MVTIVVCFQSGTEPMMGVCLDSIARHTQSPYELVVVSRDRDLEELDAMLQKMPCETRVVQLDMVCTGQTTSRVHGMMLDLVIPSRIETEYVLTLDSDAFPVAHGWLSELVRMLESGAGCAGILHPWGPPPENMATNKIEWKVRSQQCWKNTHVACQLVRTDFLEETGVRFNAGDDTGLLIPQKVVETGLPIDGFRPTRSPLPKEEFDTEFNRYVGIIYGDKVYHHGGFTRTTMGDTPIFNLNFGWVTRAIVAENGSEWLLDDEKSYSFRFDKEEEIAQEKTQRLFGLDDQGMKG